MVNTIKGNGLQEQLANLKHFLKTNYNKKEPQEALDHHRLRAFTDILVTALEGIYPDRIKFDKSERGLHLMVVDDLLQGKRVSGSKGILQLILSDPPDGPLFIGFEKFATVDEAVKSCKHAFRTIRKVPMLDPEYQKASQDVITETKKRRAASGIRPNKK